MSFSLRRMVSVPLLIAAEAAAVLALHRLGRIAALDVPMDDLRGWLTTADPELATAALARLVAFALACWLLITTVLYAAAQALRCDVPAALLGPLTLPAARRLLDRALVAGVLATALVSRAPTASAGPAPDPVTAELRSGRLDSSSASH